MSAAAAVATSPFAGLFGGGGSGAVERKSAAAPVAASTAPGEKSSGLPEYTATDVKAHDGKGADKTVWVTYGDGVYDVTSFMSKHPGTVR